MSAHGDKYVLDAGKSGHARLRVISEIHDDHTRALLLGAGLEAGHRFVEFGCGLGYVTRWATSVGADALGLDLSADQIEEARQLADGKTEFRVASVYDHDLPPESVDIAYSRWLLIHLNEPVVAIRSRGMDTCLPRGTVTFLFSSRRYAHGRRRPVDLGRSRSHASARCAQVGVIALRESGCNALRERIARAPTRSSHIPERWRSGRSCSPAAA
jgi:SAM-dependent methyltransferase